MKKKKIIAEIKIEYEVEDGEDVCQTHGAAIKHMLDPFIKCVKPLTTRFTVAPENSP